MISIIPQPEMGFLYADPTTKRHKLARSFERIGRILGVFTSRPIINAFGALEKNRMPQDIMKLVNMSVCPEMMSVFCQYFIRRQADVQKLALKVFRTTIL